MDVYGYVFLMVVAPSRIFLYNNGLKKLSFNHKEALSQKAGNEYFSPRDISEKKGQSLCFSGKTNLQNIPNNNNDFPEFAENSKEKQWETLCEKMKNFQDCALRFSAMNTVCGEGNLHGDFLFVGEAPGAQEDAQGRPFVGASGQLLEKILGSIHLQRENVFITNIVPWRPPFNRTPTPEEIQQCLPFVHEHIAIIRPKILVCLGSVSFHGLFPEFSTTSITKAHDLSLTYSRNGLTIHTYVLYHPSYLLRSSVGKPKTWEQLKKIKKFYDTL